MPIKITDAPSFQTLEGQPAGKDTPATEADKVGAPATAAAATDATAQVTDETVDADAGAAGAPDATVNISPDALRQITTLSKHNRDLKKQLQELQGKVVPPEDVATKLKRLEALEGALKSPKEWLKLAELDIEKVYEDVLPREGADATQPDARVTDLVSSNQTMRKELDELKNARKADEESVKTQQTAQQRNEATTHVKSLIDATKLEDGSLRWDRLANSKDGAKTATEAVDAVMIVYTRDYAEQKDDKGTVVRAGKTFDAKVAQQILEQALDEAESLELARELVEQRKKAGQDAAAGVTSRGITIRSVEGEGQSRLPAKPTADGNRGPTRSIGVQRGPVSVAIARARALRMVGADERGK